MEVGGGERRGGGGGGAGGVGGGGGREKKKKKKNTRKIKIMKKTKKEHQKAWALNLFDVEEAKIYRLSGKPQSAPEGYLPEQTRKEKTLQSESHAWLQLEGLQIHSFPARQES